jgi:hypothetical protein
MTLNQKSLIKNNLLIYKKNILFIIVSDLFYRKILFTWQMYLIWRRGPTTLLRSKSSSMGTQKLAGNNHGNQSLARHKHGPP